MSERWVLVRGFGDMRTMLRFLAQIQEAMRKRDEALKRARGEVSA